MRRGARRRVARYVTATYLLSSTALSTVVYRLLFVRSGSITIANVVGNVRTLFVVVLHGLILSPYTRSKDGAGGAVRLLVGNVVPQHEAHSRRCALPAEGSLRA